MGLQIRSDEATPDECAGCRNAWSGEHRRLLVAVHRLRVRGWTFTPTMVAPDVDGLLGALARSPVVEDAVCVWSRSARAKRVHTMAHPGGFDVEWSTSGPIDDVVQTLLRLPPPTIATTAAKPHPTVGRQPSWTAPY